MASNRRLICEGNATTCNRTGALSYTFEIDSNAKWTQNGVTVAGNEGVGDGFNQLFFPHHLYVDDDQTLYIVDSFNNRILELKNGATNGQVIAGGNGEGNRSDQLKSPTDMIADKKTDSFIICDKGNRRMVRWPRHGGTSGQTIISDIDCHGLTMDDDGFLYVCDSKKHEVRRWSVGETSGTVVAGGNGRGHRLNQLNEPNYVFIDRERSVYVSDYMNHRVMKWVEGAKEGIVVAGGQGEGDALTQLTYPEGLFADQLGTVYVTDMYNDRIMRWPKGATQGSIVVGGNGQGDHANQLYWPMGFSFDRQGNIYVVDSGNHRVQKFPIEGRS